MEDGGGIGKEDEGEHQAEGDAAHHNSDRQEHMPIISLTENIVENEDREEPIRNFNLNLGTSGPGN